MKSGSSTLSAFRRLLAPLSALYVLGVRWRNARYDRQLHATQRAALPVISIGNITVGGTGKTPLVIETVRRLCEFGRRPAILTRGYRATARQSADEVMEFARELAGVPVVVNPDRVAGARAARADFNADCLVLDDGFQHRRLQRDLDVVVIDALDPWGGGRVLPAGNLREPLGGLARADLLVISRSNQVAPATLARIEALLRDRAPDAERLCATVEPQSVVYPNERTEAVEALAYHCVLPICGIGNPATFLHCVGQLAGRVCEPLVFGDHQRYNEHHLRKIAARAERGGADLVVTTRKDWVKLAPLWTSHAGAAPELARLEIRLELQDVDGVFDNHLQRALEATK